jgi:hypothetical protein
MRRRGLIFVAILVLCAIRALPSAGYFDMEIRLETSSGQPLDGHPHVRVLSALDRNELEIKEDPKQSRPGTYTVRVDAAREGGRSTDLSDRYWQIQIAEDNYVTVYKGPMRLHLDKENMKIVPETSGDATGGFITATLIRNPQKWRAKFSCDPLEGNEFDELKKVLDKSGQMYLRRDGWRTKWARIDSLVGRSFSSPTGFEDDPELDRARAALLNIYHVLNSTDGEACSAGPMVNWFRYVDKIHVINEERFIGVTTEEMFNRVLQQTKQFPIFACNISFSAPSTLHKFEDRQSRYWKDGKVPLREVVSIKTPICQGNIQITVAKVWDGTKEQTPEFLVDFDIDDHLAFLLHSADVAKHWATGSATNAYEMGEMLTILDRNRQLIADGPWSPPHFGYDLVVAKQPYRSSSCEDSDRPRLPNKSPR